MESAYEAVAQRMYLDELADLDAWEGYEFWSAQLEAKAEFLENFYDAREAGACYSDQRERKSDVLPF